MTQKRPQVTLYLRQLDKCHTAIITLILSKVLVRMFSTEPIKTHTLTHTYLNFYFHHPSHWNNKRSPKPSSNQTVDLLAVCYTMR